MNRLKNFCLRPTSPCMGFPACMQRKFSSKCNDVSRKLASFNATFPALKKQLVKNIKFKPAIEHFEKLLDYQVPYGRQTRGAIVLSVYDRINPKLENEGNADLSSVQVIAWIVELLQSYAILMDDVVDDGKLRRGKLPWHIGRERYVNVDMEFLLASCNLLLINHFEESPFFEVAFKLLQQTIFHLCCVESFDMFSLDLIKNKNVTMDLYKNYAIQKGIYSTDLPYKLAAYVATNSDLKFEDNVNKVLSEQAYLLQLMNDSLGIFDSVDSGKIKYEDIKQGSLTWFAAFTFENATESDVNIFVDNYGKYEETSLRKIVGIYNKFDFKNKYKTHEEEVVQSINKTINTISDDGLREGLKAVQEIVLSYRRVNPNIKAA